MAKKLTYVLWFIVLAITACVGYLLIAFEGRPATNTPENRAAHGVVTGQENEIRIGDKVLRFPVGIGFEPYTQEKIVKGHADQIYTGFIYPDNKDERNFALGRVHITINKVGYEDPKVWDDIEKESKWDGVIRRDDLNMLEYRRKYGRYNFVAINDADRTPRGSKIRITCSHLDDKITQCFSSYVLKNSSVSIDYTFSSNLLLDWKVINKSVVDFIDSLIGE